MRVPFANWQRRLPRASASCLAVAGVLAVAAPARAQYVQIQTFEVTPFIGTRLGGTFQIQPDGGPPVSATFTDAASYGLTAGVRFDDLSLIEFRWTQSSSALRFASPFTFVGPSVGDVTLNQFHAERMIVSGSLYFASHPNTRLAFVGSAYRAMASPGRRAP